MKKSTFYKALAYLAGAAVCLALVIRYDFRIEPILCGMVGACAAVGLKLLRQYFYWSRPENAAAYEEKQRRAQIDLRDERKVMLREKSAYVMYRILYYVEWAAVVVLAVLSTLEIGTPTTRVVMGVITLLALLQIFGGYVVYRILEKKY